MLDNRETVIAVFSDLASAQQAERALDAAGMSSHVTLIENDQEGSQLVGGTQVTDTYSRDNTETDKGGGIGGFFARLFGFDDNWDDKNESHSYFRERYAAKNHLLIVRDCSDAALARQIVQDNGGMIEERGRLLYEQEMSRYGSDTTGVGTGTRMSDERLTGETFRTDRLSDERVTDDERVMRLREEQLLATKERVQTGEVSIRKEIVQETKTIEVPVTREELVIERRPLYGEAHPGSIDASAAGETEEIRLQVSEERVHLEKQVVPTEEILVAKKRIEETESVSDTVKREEARVETKGRVDTKKDTTITKDFKKDSFRKDDFQPGV